MKSLFLYLKFIGFLLSILPEKIKVNSLKKKGRLQEAEKITEGVELRFARFTVKEAGVTISVKGAENIPEQSCLFVANHQSLLDIPVMLSAVNKPIGYIAKKELLKFKLISAWMKDTHCVFIDRSNVRESVKAINEGADNIKNGHNMAIFPEGTRSKGPEIGEFKKGSMKLALRSNALVVPVAIDGTYKILEANKGRIRPAAVDVIISKPIDPKGLPKEQSGELAELVRQVIWNSILKNRNKK